MDHVIDLINYYKLDIFAVSETWLLPSILSSFVSFPNFSVIRGDSDGTAFKHGVLIYVRKTINIEEVSVGIPNVAVIHMIDFDVYLLVAYRPPRCSDVENARLLNFILDFGFSKELIIVGDFNLPTIDWRSDYFEGYIRPIDRQFLDVFMLLGLTQWIKEPTFVVSGNILDLILTSAEDRVSDVAVLPPLPHCGHSPVMCGYSFRGPLRGNSFHGEVRQWHRGKYNLIARALSQVDWALEFSYSSVNDNFQFLQSRVISLVDRYVPARQSRCDPPWSLRPPRELITRRAAAWQAYKVIRREEGRNSDAALDSLQIFQGLNWEYRNYSFLSRRSYEAELLNRTDNRKLFHSYIRNKKVGRPAVGPLRLPDGRRVIEPVEMCEVFVTSFAGVFIPGIPQDPAPFQSFEGRMVDIEVTREAVAAVLSGLDPTSSAGPDGLHPHLLKACAEVLSVPLQMIFIKSLRTGILPAMWKQSSVVPLFKKASHADPRNYRPVSLTSVCCKAMEKLVAAQLRDFLESNGLLSSCQYGFRANRSTEDQLLLTYDDVGSWVDRGYIVDEALLDFSNAFDVVNHVLLLTMLRSIGIGDRLLEWIHAFLTNRFMSVRIDGANSRPVEVLSGVPQGSVLGPLLFLVYVNYISARLTCHCKAFADDFKLYVRFVRKDGGPFEGTRLLQANLDQIDEVASSWNLKLNPEKCAVIRFYRGRPDVETVPLCNTYFLQGRPLRFVHSQRDLGVVVDSSLRFHQHIQTVAAKAGGLASSLLRSTVCRSPDFMVSLFVSHVRPILDYASCVWNTGYVGDSRLLEQVQRRWTKQIDGLHHLSYRERLETLSLFSVKGRRLRADLIKYWQIIRGELGDLHELFSFAPDVGTRGHRFKLVLPLCSMDVRSRSFSVRCINKWNSLPSRVVEADTLSKFKGALCDTLYDELLDYD